jgi:alcohol dehydrogenase
MGLAEAGSLPKVALTSYKALVWYANLDTRPMDERTILVLGGSGGTGTVGLQLAKKVFNATKVTTTTSADNFDYCRSNGADELIDYKTTNWWEVVPDGSQDIVYDCVGQSGTGDYAVKKLKTGGSYVTITGNLAIRVPPGVSQHSFINSRLGQLARGAGLFQGRAHDVAQDVQPV